MMRRFRFIIWFFLISAGIVSTVSGNQGKVHVITTLFPLYDFVRAIGQENVSVELLLPPGVEAHSFEPSPRDVVRINHAQLFVYTSPDMEPWAVDVIAGIANQHVVVVNASQNIPFSEPLQPIQSKALENKPVKHAERIHSHDHAAGRDPHIWVNFSYAQIMVDTIAAGLVQVDPQHAQHYLKNAEQFKQQLQALDKQYQTDLARCQYHTIVHAGHFVFGWMTKRYGLKQVTAYHGFSPDSEPTPKQMMALIRLVKKNKVPAIFIEELMDPKIGRMIQEETGADMLLLHGAHNITKQEMADGLTYFEIMQKNLENLKKGLGYQ